MIYRRKVIVNFLWRKIFGGNLNESVSLTEIDITLKLTSISTYGITSFWFPRKIFFKWKLILIGILVPSPFSEIFLRFYWPKLVSYKVTVLRKTRLAIITQSSFEKDSTCNYYPIKFWERLDLLLLPNQVLRKTRLGIITQSSFEKDSTCYYYPIKFWERLDLLLLPNQVLMLNVFVMKNMNRSKRCHFDVFLCF